MTDPVFDVGAALNERLPVPTQDVALPVIAARRFEPLLESHARDPNLRSRAQDGR